MIPRYQKDDNKEKALLTDKLPVVVNYINIDYVIAKRNIDRYFEDNSETYELDMNYLQTLSIDATKQIKRLKDTTDKNILNQVEYYLNNVKSETENITWQSFNINKIFAMNELKGD